MSTCEIIFLGNGVASMLQDPLAYRLKEIWRQSTSSRSTPTNRLTMAVRCDYLAQKSLTWITLHLPVKTLILSLALEYFSQFGALRNK